MVGRLFAVAIILFAITVVLCFGEDRSESKSSRCPIKLPKIKTVLIEENGARSPNYSPEINVDCLSVFKLTEKDVRRYLSLAMAIDNDDSTYDLDWSPCYASGKLIFENGKTARWDINQFMAGSISIDNNGWIQLYCPKCNFEPFTDEPEIEDDDEDDT